MPTTPNCGMGGSTFTVAEVMWILSQHPADTPVTIEVPKGSWWLNVSDIRKNEDELSLIIETTDDFDPRQF